MIYRFIGELQLKGNITCPKCNHKYQLELDKGQEKYSVQCPKCNHKFNLKIKCKDTKIEECVWQEHGEPRKTVLSSLKPKSNKPNIAAVILVIVFAIGISTAVFSELFISSTLDAISYGGVTGSVEFEIIDFENNSIENATIYLNKKLISENSKGVYEENNIDLGIQKITISKEGYKTKTTEIIVIPFFESKSTYILEKGIGISKKEEFDSFGCSLILGIFSIFSLFAIISCTKREHLDVAIAGTLLSAFSFGFFFIGLFLSIIAFIFIWKSRDEFKNGDKGRIF